jgi:hypothetical protein
VSVDWVCLLLQAVFLPACTMQHTHTFYVHALSHCQQQHRIDYNDVTSGVSCPSAFVTTTSLSAVQVAALPVLRLLGLLLRPVLL